MPNLVGFVDNGAPHGSAHKNFVKAVRDWVQAQGHAIERYDTSGTNHELIVRSPGLSGTEQIFWGLRTYENVGADYYNLLCMVATGYVAGNTFDTQPGAVYSGVPAHNQRIDYWLTLNGQRIAGMLKVGTPVYEHFYLGKLLPYARPSQYPYPVVCGGALDGASATRFSETSHDFYVRGGNNRGRLRTPSGWVQLYCWPWSTGSSYNTIAGSGSDSGADSHILRDTGGQYPLLPLMLHDNSANIYGELDGVYFVSGFNNAVENTLTISGVTYVVGQSVYCTSHRDYLALRLDT
jgi:hypothetical protein